MDAATTLSCDSRTAGFSCAATFVRQQLGQVLNHKLSSLSLGRAIQMAHAQLQQVFEECSSPAWDGYGAEPVTFEAYINARRVLDALPPDIAMPTFGAEPDGHLTMEWYRTKSHLLSLSVSPEGDLYYAALLAGGRRRSGKEPFLGDLPADLLRIIRQLNRT